MKSRIEAILACGLVILIFGSLFSLCGYHRTWRLWNIPTMSPHFADLRTITGGAESYARGLDPMVENPGDPWHRRLNYPRVWQSLYSIGVNQSHTTYIGIGFILLFLVGVCLVLPHASHVMIVLVMAAVLSPATILGVERGNTDLLMFFLVSISLVAVKKWHVLSAVAVLLGFVLKLFPIFGCAVLLRLSRSLFMRYVLVVFAIVTVYVLLTYTDILLISEGTQKGTIMSYGLDVFWVRTMSNNTTLGVYARLFSYLTVLSTIIFAFSALLRNDFPPDKKSEAVYLDAFRAGSAIYLGTFLLGNSWDYRLIFLILAIPQLVVWTKCSTRYVSMGAGVILSSVFVSLWHLVIAGISSHLPHGMYASFMAKEISNWVVFSGLLYLFFWSMPDWVKRYSQKMYSLTKHST